MLLRRAGWLLCLAGFTSAPAVGWAQDGSEAAPPPPAIDDEQWPPEPVPPTPVEDAEAAPPPPSTGGDWEGAPHETQSHAPSTNESDVDQSEPDITFGPYARRDDSPKAPLLEPPFGDRPERRRDLQYLWTHDWQRKEPSRSVFDVSSAKGPVVTLVGGGILIGGNVLAATAFTGVSGSSSEESTDGRDARLSGGVLFGTLIGSMLIVAGVDSWRADLGEADRAFVHKAPWHSPKMMVAGSIMAGVGVLAVGTALVGNFLGDNTEPRHALNGATGPILLVGGATALAVGMPVALLGGRKLPYSESVEVSLGPSATALRGRW